MDNRVLMAGLGLLALVGVGVAGMVVMGGGGEPDGDTPEAVEDKNGEPTQAKANGSDLDAPGYRQEHDPEDAKPREDGPVKPGEAEHDETYEERAKMHRERRAQRNAEWQTQTMEATRKWIASEGLDEAQGLQVQGIIQKSHDTITQTKLDMEDGVIRPAEGREEIKWAKEEKRIQLANMLGEEKADALIDHVNKAIVSGI